MRTSTRSALPALFVVLCFAAPLFAQSVNKEPVTKAQRGSISGHVTVKDKPARGVTIGLRKSGLMSDSFTTAVTDPEGNYRISDVPAGSYLVMVSAPAFIDSEPHEYKTIVLSEGENVDDVDFSLVRGGVITGKVTDGEGRPVILQNVFIVPVGGVDSLHPPLQSVTVQTDDRGIYRAFGIRPGSYRVAAGQGDKSAPYFGNPSKYKRVYYPDVTDVAKATVIQVTEGSEASKVDIKLATMEQMYSISGRIVHQETGAPVPNLNFNMRSNVGQRVAFGRSDERGEFVVENMAPGKYGLLVVDQSGLRGDNVTLEVIDQDLTDVTIKLSTGATVSGVVILETEDRAARAKLSEMRVEGSVRPPPSTPSRLGIAASSPIGADGSFTLRGLMNGTLNVGLASVRSAYPLKGFSISRIERDGVVTRGIELQEGQNVTGVKIVVGYGTASVRGVVAIENGPLPASARIFLRLTQPGQNSSFFRTAPADDRGRFVVDGLAPGLYEISASVSGLPRSPKLGRQQVSLTDGVVTEVNLTIDLAVPEYP